MIGNKGQATGLLWVVGIAVVAIALSQFGLLDGLLGKQTVTPGGAPAATAFCPDSSVTMTLGPVTKWRNPSATTNQEYHRVYVEGVDQGLKVDGSTLSVRVNKPNGDANKIAVYYAENSTNYYSAESKFDVPCGAFDSASLSGNKYKLMNHSADVTFNEFNEDDGDLNSVSNNQSITANEEVTFTIDWKGTSDEGLSPYGEVVVVLDYNSSEFDVSKFDLTGGKKTTAPSFHTLFNNGFKSVAWRLPGGPNPSTDESGRWLYKGDLTAQSKSTAPSTDNAFTFFNVTLYTENYGQDPDNAEEIFGTEDSQGTNLGFNPISSLVYYEGA